MASIPPYVAGVFFQANTIKGYEAWDHIGVVANEMSARFTTITYGPLGLVCGSPVDTADHFIEVRVDSQLIHLSYRAGVQPAPVHRQSAHLVEWIAKAINVTQFSRLGLRTQLVFAREDADQANTDFRDRLLPVHEQQWEAIGAVRGGEMTLHLAMDDLAARVFLQPTGLIPNNAKQPIGLSTNQANAPHYGIMLDVDIARVEKTFYTDLQPYLRRCDHWLNERIVPHIERLLQGERS